MAMKNIYDLRIINNIRVELIRRKIDFTKLRLLSDGGYVTIVGRLVFVNYTPTKSKIPSLLEALDKDLRRLAYVKFVKYYLENWTRNEQGRWIEVETSDGDDKVKFWLEDTLIKLDTLDFKQRFIKDIRNTERISAFISDNDKSVRDLAIKCAEKIGIKSLYEPLFSLFNNHKIDVDREQLLYSLTSCDNKRAFPILKNEIKKDNKKYLLAAIKAISMINSTDIVPILLPFLKYKDDNIKAYAVKGISRFGKNQVINSIREMIASDDENLKDAAIDALSKIKKNYSVPLLIRMLKDSSASIRFKALRVLNKLKDERLLKQYLKMLELEKDEYIKASLVKSIASYGKSSLIEKISPFLSDIDSRVRANTIEALDMLLTKENAKEITSLVLPLIEDDNSRVRVNAIDLLSKTGTDLTEKLFHMLKSPDPVLFSSATYALSANPDEKIVKRLFKELFISDSAVKSVIADTLRKISTKKPEIIYNKIDDIKSELRELNDIINSL